MMDNKRLNDEGRDLWNNKAKFWDNLQGDAGNEFHRSLVSPSVENLLDLQAGESVLDIGCGNGVLARRLAELGGKVTAVDFSSEMIELASARQQASGEPIHYAEVDATDEEALLALGIGQFDAITCTMTLMDIPTIAPLYRAVAQLLTENGRFVFSTMHPAFNSNNPIFVMERGDVNGQLYTYYSLKISDYLDVPPMKGAGAADEPNPHYYYHRPMGELLGTAFESGLVLDGMDEPAFPRINTDRKKGVGWDTLWQIPPVLSCRLRVGK